MDIYEIMLMEIDCDQFDSCLRDKSISHSDKNLHRTMCILLFYQSIISFSLVQFPFLTPMSWIPVYRGENT